MAAVPLVAATPTAPLSQCARASSTSESRYRIQRPIVPARAARIVALDARAEGVVRRLAEGLWADARFFTSLPPGPGEDVCLSELDGPDAPLDQVLYGTDVVVVLATEDGGQRTAAAIGRLCGRRGITTAGIVLGDGFEAADAVAALRPYARVLLLSADEGDAFELLAALRV